MAKSNKLTPVESLIVENIIQSIKEHPEEWTNSSCELKYKSVKNGKSIYVWVNGDWTTRITSFNANGGTEYQIGESEIRLFVPSWKKRLHRVCQNLIRQRKEQEALKTSGIIEAFGDFL